MSQLDIETGPLTPGQEPCVVCNLDDRTRAATDMDDPRCHECRAFDKAREVGQFMRMVPEAVKAVQWSGTAHDAHRVIKWAGKHGLAVTYHCTNEAGCLGGGSGHYLEMGRGFSLPGINTMVASNWLVRLHGGSIHTYDDSTFRQEFSPIDPELMRGV